jgi:hypothetical protein
MYVLKPDKLRPQSFPKGTRMPIRIIPVVFAVLLSGCLSEEKAPEKCKANTFNARLNVDCTKACDHIAVCTQTDSDSDLKGMTCSSCLEACMAGVALGGNDLIQGTAEDSASWVCTEKIESCNTLDHTCDLF